MKETAIKEANVCPARWVLSLPEPTTLLCAGVPRSPGIVLFSSARVAVSRARRKGVPAFDREEWLWAVLSVANSRGTLRDYLRWYCQKLATPAWRLSKDEALGLIGERLFHQEWCTGRVLKVLGVELVDVCIGHEVPEALDHV